MQLTTRWCLNEGSMSSCTDDQNGLFHKAYKPPFVPNRPSKFTGQCSNYSVSNRWRRRPSSHVVSERVGSCVCVARFYIFVARLVNRGWRSLSLAQRVVTRCLGITRDLAGYAVTGDYRYSVPRLRRPILVRRAQHAVQSGGACSSYGRGFAR
jgi:hypothetical protein